MKNSISALILTIFGLLVAYMIFPPFNISFGKGSMLAIPIGFIIFLIGVTYGIIAFYKKEKGVLKYISLTPIPLGVLYVVFIFYLFEGLI
ncbi:hypothetical protein [Jeotgalibacillus aurantiacus]|uniref:hypothetical protein n=1 Tax=Jeotgalibacillus aurantiacus TaxID=2763266 RepID=UPI001D0A5D77|nr:hypothetical protein [Jeotgalibacillus aurantiacus]